jgi:hypothetical protein
MAEKKKDRYDEIVARLKELDNETIKNQNEKDAFLKGYRQKQSKCNVEVAQLNRELVKVIGADPERAKKYQKPGNK